MPAIDLTLKRGLVAEAYVFSSLMSSAVLYHMAAAVSPSGAKSVSTLMALYGTCACLSLLATLWYWVGWSPDSDDISGGAKMRVAGEGVVTYNAAMYIVAFAVILFLRYSGFHKELEALILVVCAGRGLLIARSLGISKLADFLGKYSKTDMILGFLLGGVGEVLRWMQWNKTYFISISVVHVAQMLAAYFLMRSKVAADEVAQGASPDTTERIRSCTIS